MALVPRVAADGQKLLEPPEREGALQLVEEVEAPVAQKPIARGVFAAAVGVFTLGAGLFLQLQPSAKPAAALSALALTFAGVLSAWLARVPRGRWLELGAWPLVAPLALLMPVLGLFDTVLAVKLIPAGLEAAGGLALGVGVLRVAQARLEIAQARLFRRRKWAVRRQGHDKPIKLPLAGLRTGDVIEVSKGQRLPIDAIVEDGDATVEAELLFQGEPPRQARPGDTVLAGSLVASGRSSLRLLAPPEQSFWARRVSHTHALAAQARAPSRSSTITATSVLALSLVGTGVLFYLSWENKLVEVLLPGIAAILLAGAAAAPALSVARAKIDALAFALRRGVVFANAAQIEQLAGVRRWFVDGDLLAAPGRIETTALGEVDENQVIELAAALLEEESSPAAVTLRGARDSLGLEVLKPAALRRTQAIFHGTVAGARWLLGPSTALAEEEGIRPSEDQDRQIDRLRKELDLVWLLARPDRGVVGALGLGLAAKEQIASAARALGATLLPGLPDLQAKVLAEAAGIAATSSPLGSHDGSLLGERSPPPSAGLALCVVEPSQLVRADLGRTSRVLVGSVGALGETVGAMADRLARGRRWGWLTLLFPVPIAVGLAWLGVGGPLSGAGLALLAVSLAARSRMRGATGEPAGSDLVEEEGEAEAEAEG